MDKTASHFGFWWQLSHFWCTALENEEYPLSELGASPSVFCSKPISKEQCWAPGTINLQVRSPSTYLPQLADSFSHQQTGYQERSSSKAQLVGLHQVHSLTTVLHIFFKLSSGKPQHEGVVTPVVTLSSGECRTAFVAVNVRKLWC